ncbi:hypothetical protein BC940DRAFT_335222 [Gongronella butleri]|nr:hypothetical protein BC940DRAFT_335222 [Gongronella butleri]
MREPRKRRRGDSDEPVAPELLVFGYEAKLYRDDMQAQRQQDGKHLIPLAHDPTRRLDRYDARHVLEDDMRSAQSVTRFHCDEDAQLDAFRFEDIGSDEEDVYEMSSAEDRRDYMESKRSRRTAPAESSSKRFHYRYDADEEEEVELEWTDEQKELADAYGITDRAVQLPATKDDAQRVISTASNLVEKGDAALAMAEIRLQVATARDPAFSFLHQQDVHHAFYRQVLRHLQSTRTAANGTNESSARPMPSPAASNPLVAYASSSSDDDSDHESNERRVDVPSEDLRRVIEKTARSVARVGAGLETRIRQGGHANMAFLNPDDRFHAFYQQQLRACQHKDMP